MRMPRVSNSGKRHQGASNQRDTRHENGLVGPGKRVIKQKSQSQLDGGLKPAADGANAPPVPPLPATLNGSPVHPDDLLAEPRTANSVRRASLGTYSETSSADSLPVPPANATAEETHRRIDVNDAKNTNVHRDPGPLDFAITVLRSCPLHDTIAILIILMQASPAVLATIYMLFTFLTFVPPVTTSSGLSIAEIFDGNQGTPSLTTLICMDVIMLGIWLFLWAPMQQFILDLAQVVISLTLGGGGTSRQGTTSNILLCVAIVGASHWTQYARWSGLSRLTSLFGSNRFFSSGGSTVRAFDKKGPYGWVRSVLAIHILTQGLVRYIREWYLRRERRDLQSQGLGDPEAGKSVSFAAEGCSDVALMAADSDAHLQTSAAHLSSKKRRKQSAQVRVRQPLWAALASTKIVMVKEYELSHAANESAGSNATDIHNLGNAPFNTQPQQIWICYVGCDEVCFNTSHFPEMDEDITQEDDKLGIDISKPFYVRVNNAIWQPTRIIPIGNGEEESSQGTRWTGDIYGLTPLSNYECEFVSTQTGEVIFSTSVRTIQAKTKDLEATPKPAGAARSHARHDSPATTLRASIAAAEVKLADEKARLKAVRKDNNRRLNAARKEIEKLSSAVQSAGGDDEKLRQKVAQNKIQEKRAEESITELEAELKEFETVPEALLNEYRAKHNTWTSEKAKFDEARASFKSFKSSIDKQIKSLEEERASLQAKRNKIATRLAKVDDEHARITDANARGLNEAERRRQERANLEAELARAEQNLRDRMQTIRTSNLAKQAQIQEMANQMQAYLSSFQDDMTYDVASQPPTHYGAGPSAAWPAAAPGQYNTPSVWPPVSMPPAQNPPLLAPSQLPSAFPIPVQPNPAAAAAAAAMTTPPPHRTRGRSSSMLSNVSGFTQSTDDDDHNDTGSGSGSASLNNNPGVIGAPIGSHLRGHHQLGNGSANSSPHAYPHHQHQHQHVAHPGAGTASTGPSGTVRGPPPGFLHFKAGASGSSGGSGSLKSAASGSGSGSGSGFGSGGGSGRSSVRSGSGSGASLGAGSATGANSGSGSAGAEAPASPV